jgi:hypothetical protein
MTPPKYLHAVLALAASVPRGESRFVEVRHDPWCPLLTQGGPCACTPEVQLGPSLGEARAC